MSKFTTVANRWNVPVLAGQGSFAIIAWTMASPSIVLTFLAVSLDLPLFLAGALVAIRHSAATGADVLVSGPLSRKAQKKHAIAFLDLAIAGCFALAIVAAIHGTKPMIVAAFIAVIFLIGLLEEAKSLMITDFLSDNLSSATRMRVHYIQLALGAGGAIALTWFAHKTMEGNEPITRHTVVVAIAIVCFIVSALSILAFREVQSSDLPKDTEDPSARSALMGFFLNAHKMFQLPWFRRFMAIRLSLVIVGLSVPFFALIAAESHKASAKGLTALVISSAAGMLVAAPLWRGLNAYSNRLVMTIGALLVSLTGCVLIGAHVFGFDDKIHLHATSLFVATLAVTGITGARGLYFMDIAPKSDRVLGQAVGTSTTRILIIASSALLAAIAHMLGAAWSVVLITLAGFVATLVCLAVAKPTVPSHEPASHSAHPHSDSAL